MMDLLTDFKAFILRGNVVELAIGVVIGAAFKDLVSALVKDLFTPIIGIPGKADFSQLFFQIHGSKFLYGDFVNQVISYVLISVVLFFFVVRPLNKLMALQQKEGMLIIERQCPFCCNMIAAKAIKCGFCTADLPPLGGVPVTNKVN